MLKPVSILALDEIVAPLAQAVQERVAAVHGVEDLVQAREAGGDPQSAIQSMFAQRQRPDSPLRMRDDVGTRELVLVMLAAAGPARTSLIETVRRIRNIYESRNFASFVSVEILCLLPEAAGSAAPEDYAAAYALLKALSAENEKPFQEVWLLDATNGQRVRFGAVDAWLNVYADAIAGALTYEPEMSGALPGIHPRGMHPTYSSFGYASLVFPREHALQRVESRFATELVRDKLLSGTRAPGEALAARQFLVSEEFALPLSRIGVEGGQSLFRRFQPKTRVTEATRSADELVAAVRNELQTFRDSTHLKNLDKLAKQGDATTREHAVLLARAMDQSLDANGYDAAAGLLEALLDPLPELRPDAELTPRTLATEIRTATAALDARLHFTANTTSSDAARRRVRELATLLEDQTAIAETLATDDADHVGALARERSSLLERIPDLILAEERENSVGRTATRDAETARLTAETEAREQELREMFVRLPRAEQALREAQEARRTWLWQQLFLAIAITVAIVALGYFVHIALSLSLPFVLTAFVIFAAIRYVTHIAPPVRDARERLARLHRQIETADQAKNDAYNAELQFEHDVMHRRAALRVLRDDHDAAKDLLASVHERRAELEALAHSFTPPALASTWLSLSVIDDEELDVWYARTADDRKPFAREFPIGRAESRRIAMDEIRRRIAAHAATAFGDLRKLTLATAAASLADAAKLAQRWKRLADQSAPLIELREDDLQAQRSMQRDCTLWIESDDAAWAATLRRRFPEGHVRSAPDALSVHVITRILHYPGYILGAVDYYRACYEASAQREHAEAADLVPPEVVFGARVHEAYEHILLGRALGIISMRDGQLAVSDALLGDTHLAAAQRLASPENAASREQLDDALLPRLEIAGDVTRELRALRQSLALTPLDRDVLDGLLKKYATLT